MQDQLSPIEIARQLKKPEGELGITIGNNMNQGNKIISDHTYQKLDIKDGESVLEIGMGNGKLIPTILVLAKNVQYTGIDYSPTMVKEAIMNNTDLVSSKKIEIQEGNISQLPFEDYSFHKIATVNTIYFWPSPLENIQELFRVLKPNGKLTIGFRPKHIMDHLEITNYGFIKYTREAVIELAKESGFHQISCDTIKEPPRDFLGKTYELEGCYLEAYKK